jgi:hypothetical protein
MAGPPDRLDDCALCPDLLEIGDLLIPVAEVVGVVSSSASVGMRRRMVHLECFGRVVVDQMTGSAGEELAKRLRELVGV